MQALEATFGCPVIESYGMTEAAHQMASNPLPPAARKPGTVGVERRAGGGDPGARRRPAAARRAGRDRHPRPERHGRLCQQPQRQCRGLRNGWFRTGDLGFLDPEGYLTISGRLKEIINRGGEKISPREIDEVLMDHPAVAQAADLRHAP